MTTRAQLLLSLRGVALAPLLLGLWIAFSALTPLFATSTNVRILLAASAVVAVAAAGETLVLLTGGIDLSIATVVSCSAVLSATVMGETGSALTGLAVAVGVGLVFGLVNGVAIGVLDLTPFVLTLGTYLVARGVAFSVSDGVSLSGAPPGLLELGSARIAGIPAIALVAVAVFVVVGLALVRTRWGREVYLVGSNEAAARHVGIRTRAVKASVYVVAGGLAGVAGYLSIMNLGVATPGIGDTLLLSIIGAAIVGGTSLFGGEGSMGRTALGVLLLASLTNGLNLLNFEFFDQLVAQGLVILVGTALVVRMTRA